MSKKNLQQNISNKSGQSSSGNSGSSVPAYTGMTEELYTSLRQKGYTQDQIKKAYSGTPKMTEDLYKSLRQKGYTQEQIKSGQFDREFLIPWRTAGSANKNITEWGKIANDFSAWSGGLSNDWNDWDLDTANSWLETLRKNAQQARTIMQDLARQGLTSGSEEFDTYQSYYDYFSKAARSLANNNNSYVGYRDANMYQGSDGQYYSYDDVLKMEEGLKNDVAGMNLWNGIGWESDASTMGGHIVFNYDPEEKREKNAELERMGTWLGDQNQKRDMADWYAKNFTPGMDTIEFSNNAVARLDELQRQKEEAEKTRPDLQRQYAISDELGNVYDYDYDAYNRDLQKWNDEHSVLFEDLAAAERDYKYANDSNFRFFSALKNASADSPDVQAAIARGKEISDGYLAEDEEYRGVAQDYGNFGGSEGAWLYHNVKAGGIERKHADTSSWSKDKLNAYYFLLGSDMESDAERFAEITNDALSAEFMMKQVYEPIDEWQKAHPVLGDVAATAAGVVIPLYIGLPEYMANAYEYAVTGNIDPNKPSPIQISNRMVGNTANQLNGVGSLDDVTKVHIPVIGDKGLGDVYQLGISIMQSALSRGTSGGMQGVVLAQFFGSAATSGIYDGLSRGMDPGRALLLGTMNGCAEAIGEVVSLDKLLAAKNAAGMRKIFQGVLVQMGIEGSEEAFTTVMNTLADIMVNGDMSEIEISVQSYMSQGMSREEAEKRAVKEWINGVAFDAIGGALSGGISAVGTNIGRNIGTYRDSTRYLMDLAQQTAEGSKSREMLQGIENEFTRKSGRKPFLGINRANISASHGNQFAEQVKQDLISQNTDTAVRAIENRLTELGETGDLHQKAQVMADYLISEMSGDNEVGFGLKISDQISANATANMRQVMGELQQARENFSSADYALQNESWTDEVMKGRFLDAEVLRGNRYATADYQFGRSMEKNLTQMADLEQQISDARAELETLSPADTERKAELRNVIQEAETKLNEARTRQNAVLQDKYDSYSETDKNASVQIDGQEYKVSGLTKDGDVKLTGADGATTTVSVDDDRLPSAFRSLALKTKALGWASSAAFDYYKPGTDINRYIARVQNIRAIASEKIGRDAFMASSVVKALDNAPLAEFLYNQGQDLHDERQKEFQDKLNETKKKIAAAKTKSEAGRVKGSGKVDTVSGFDVNGKHFEGIQGMKLSKTQQAVVDMVNSLADTLNINYVIYNGEASGVNGAYRDGADPIIAININAGKHSGGKLIRALAAETLSHELTHFIEHFAEEEYASLRDAVVDVMFNKDSDAFARRVQNAERLLPENFKGDRNDAAVREVVADACTQMLKNSEMVTEIARQNMTAAQKVKDFIDQTVEKIRNAITAAFADSDPKFYRQEAKLILDEAERIQQLWDDGLKAATENYNAVQEGSAASEQYQTARDDYNESVRIDNRIEEINDELAAIQLENDSASKEKRRRLENELVKLEYDAEQLAKKERSLTRKTSINELLENLDDYRPNDLISLANQLTDSSWDGVEDMQSDELREELRQMLEERAEDLTELERQAPKYGLFVRPVDRAYSAPAKSGGSNIVQFPGTTARYQVAERDNADLLRSKFDAYESDQESLRLAAGAITDLQLSLFGDSDSFYKVYDEPDAKPKKPSRQQVRTLGKAISTDMVNEGYVEFRGRTVRGPADVAKMCQCLRDPRFETFRLVLTKGNKVVSVRSITSKLPGLTLLGKANQSNEDVAKEILSRMRRTGADGYYFVHNHPNGKVEASLDDLRSTRTFLQLIGRDTFKGHIILDHNKYGLIEDIPTEQQVGRGRSEILPKASVRRISSGSDIDFLHQPAVEHPDIGTITNNFSKIAALGHKIQTSQDVSVIVYLSADLAVNEIQEVLNSTFLNNSEFSNYIRNQMVDSGSTRVALYTSSDEVFDHSLPLFRSGFFVDSIQNQAAPGRIPLFRSAYEYETPEEHDFAGKDLGDFRQRLYSPESQYDQFQMAGEIEETDRLIAVHNKSVSGLKRMLERNGVPFPSIAIKRAGTSHEGFGDVTIVFPRSTIDPQADRQNRLYSNDAWTPTEPREEFDAGDMSRYSKNLRNEIGEELFDGLHGYASLEKSDIERKLGDNSGNVFEALKSIPLLKYAYLKSIDKAPNTMYKAASLDGFNKYKNEQILAIIDALSGAEIESLAYEDTEKKQRIADALNEQFRSQFDNGSKAFKALLNKPLYEADDINVHMIQDAYAKYKENNYSIPFEVDYGAMERSLRGENDLQNDPGYKKWIENTFADLIVDRGIPNGVDLFTPSGNRRSFKARHIPATLENVVRQMKKEQERGIGVLGINLRGAATKSYSSVEEMRSESGKLLGTQINDDVYDSYMKGFYERFHELGSQASKSKDWSQIDSAEEILLEAVRDSKSKAQMDSKLRKEAQWINYSEDLTDDLWQLRNDVQNMPAPYFEAKPRRVVYPEEALAYILPDNADSDVIKQLQDRNYNVMTYEAGNEEDRLAKVNSVDGAQFQMADRTADDTLFESDNRTAAWNGLKAENKILRESAERLAKEIENLTKRNDKLAREFKRTLTPEIRLNDAKKLAREIVRMTQRDPITTRDKQYNKELADELAERIKGVADYIVQSGESMDYDKVTEMAYEIAQDIVNNAEAEIDDGGATKEMREQMKVALKGKAIYVAPNVRADTLDWGAFKKSHRDIFTFREDGTPIDMVYESLLDEVPGLLDPKINNPGDMLNEMAEKWDLLQPKYENPYEQYENEAVSHFMNMIIESALDGTLRQVAPTYADKMNSRLAALREERDAKVDKALKQGRERVSDLRAVKNARIEEVRQEGIARKQEALAKEREAKWAKVAEAESIGRERVAALRAQKNEKIDRVYREGLKSKQEAVAKERSAKWAKEAAAKQEGRERLAELRAEKNERIDAVRKYYQEMRERSAIRRANGSTRTRIKKLINDLNNKLIHPTELNHVPPELVKGTIDILNMIDLDSGRGGVKLMEKIAKLQQQYAKLQNDPSFAKYAYDSVVAENITKMAQVVGDTPLRNMSANQLEVVLHTLTELEHMIRKGVNQKIHEENINLYESGKNAFKATNGVSTNSSKLLGNAADFYFTNTMRPDVVFDRFGGFAKDSEWVKLYNMLNNAQRYGMDLQMKFAQPFEELLKDKENLRKLTSAKESDLVDIGLKDENGDAIKVTRDFMLFVYMNLFNEDNIRHVMFGGITVPELKEYLSGKGDRGFGKGHRKAVGISERLSALNDAINNSTDVTEKARLLEEKDALLKEGMEYIDRLRSNIESKLTDYDKKWVKAWWKFNELSSEAMNQTTFDVYGIKKFVVENYFPIITDKNYVDVPMENIIKDMSLENAGFTKERIHASTPIKMMGLADVINMQANRSAQYAAMMPAVRAFNRIWNTTLPGYSSSLRDTVNSKFGSTGVNFVQNLLSDLQGGRHGDFTIFDRLRGHMAQATLSLNPRVALAQTASFPTAAAELGWRPVRKALARGGKKNQFISAADRELIAKWSSALWFRTKGATGDLADVKNMQQAAHKVMDKMGWAMNWIEFMDGATVGRLWYAAQYYVDEKNPELKKGSDAYYEKVAEAFNRCIERTQPNYTTMQRPELLRNPNPMIRALSMFMTQRLQNQSIMYCAVMKYNKYKSDLASGKNGVTQADVNEMRDRLINAATSQIVAGFTIALFKALCDGLLHKWGKNYRDDDEELKVSSVCLEIANMWAESLVSNVVGGSELYTIAKSIITGERYYGIELSGVSTFTDAIKDFVSLAQKPSLKGAKKLGQDFCIFFGIPEANAEKIGMALWNWGKDAVNGEFMEAGVERTSAQNARLLMNAYSNDDEKKIEKFSSEFKDDDTKLDAVRQQIKDGYVAKKQTISKTEAVELLVKAGMRKKDAEAKVQEWTCEVVTGIPFSKIKDEFMKGNITQFRVAELLQKYGGRDKESAEKTAMSYACEKDTGHPYNDLKQAYLEGEITRSQLTAALKKYGLMNGKESENKATFYDYLKDMPDSKISEQRAVTFMQSIKKTGVTAKQYEDMVLNVDADDSGGYSQKEVGGYIQKHSFTDAQINALWKAFGKTWKTDFYTWEVKMAADATGTGKGKNNGNVSQAELGYYLVDEIKAGRMTMAQAEKYWKSLLTTSKKDFQQWCKSKRIKFN